MCFVSNVKLQYNIYKIFYVIRENQIRHHEAVNYCLSYLEFFYSVFCIKQVRT